MNRMIAFFRRVLHRHSAQKVDEIHAFQETVDKITGSE